MKVRLVGPWDLAIKILGETVGVKRGVVSATAQVAQRFRGHVIKNLQSSGAHSGAPFKPHSPFSYVIRKFVGSTGGTKPLMTTIGLGGIIVKKVAGGWFVGVQRAAQKWRDPATHEHGAVWRTTERQRRFLLTAARSGGAASPGKGGGMMVITIPARPFMGPTIAKYGNKDVVRKHYQEALRREFSKSILKHFL